MSVNERKPIDSLNLGILFPDKHDPKRTDVLQDIYTLLLHEKPPVNHPYDSWKDGEVLSRVTSGYFEMLSGMGGNSHYEACDNCLELAFHALNRHVRATAIGESMSMLLRTWSVNMGDGNYIQMWDNNIDLDLRSGFVNDIAQGILKVAESDDPLIRREAIETFINLAGYASNIHIPKPWPEDKERVKQINEVTSDYSRFTTEESLRLIDRENDIGTKCDYLLSLLNFIRDDRVGFDDEYRTQAQDEVLSRIGDLMNKPENALLSLGMIFDIWNSERATYKGLKFTGDFTLEKVLGIVENAWPVVENFNEVKEKVVSELVTYMMTGELNKLQREKVARYLVKKSFSK